jgi:hypothetical protein
MKKDQINALFSWGNVLLGGSSELALDILEVGSVPAFGHLAISKSAAGMDVEANLPPGRSGCTHKLRSRVGCADFQICFYDVVSRKAHSADKICSSGTAALTCRRKILN